ncbi:hypothetical protein ACFC58_20860 [Kitasatospora purpeofusca]|uniref:hypothetical protein n=1 Tax=Kitasatospora purpeofusca TaxID=67352 RepID=UPI0035E206EF
MCRTRKGNLLMGSHEKPPPDPGKGEAPPGNADGQVPRPDPGADGKHRGKPKKN